MTQREQSPQPDDRAGEGAELRPVVCERTVSEVIARIASVMPIEQVVPTCR